MKKMIKGQVFVHIDRTTVDSSDSLLCRRKDDEKCFFLCIKDYSWSHDEFLELSKKVEPVVHTTLLKHLIPITQFCKQCDVATLCLPMVFQYWNNPEKKWYTCDINDYPLFEEEK